MSGDDGQDGQGGQDQEFREGLTRATTLCSTALVTNRGNTVQDLASQPNKKAGMAKET